ncbi:hypothetical protein FB451DRAFT_1043693, partial [Mycena latifolia]
LDSVISSGGGNLSVGQRTYCRLCPTFFTSASGLIDTWPATSAIDCKTDGVIQTSLRTELTPDVTVLTVVHRLQTILDSDKSVSWPAAFPVCG